MNLKNREIQACTIIDGIQDELKEYDALPG